MTRRRFASMTALPLTRSHAAPPRGPVAFCYDAVFDTAALDWYAKFEFLVTGAILHPSETRKLLARGLRLIAYEWSSAFYPGDPASAHPAWQGEVQSRADQWLLQRQPSGGGAASPGKSALWYDFANPELCLRRAEHLATRLAANGYEGLFLDTLGFEQLPATMQQAFLSRHPRTDYNKAQADFLKALRAKLGPRAIIFLNQGYRQASLFLPYANFDLTESYFTAVSSQGTLFRPWHDLAVPWESIRTPMQQLVQPASLHFPQVRFVHLGYAAGTTEQVQRAILYNFAAAKLWNHDAYLTSPQVSPQMHDIYFRRLGQPLHASPQHDDAAQLAWREFEGGVVALNAGSKGAAILSGRHDLLDPPRGYYFPR